jgi:hypothetical protein
MKRLTVTLGIVEGAPVVLVAPSFDPNEHIAHLRSLTDNGGLMERGKKTIAVSEAMVLHSEKGKLKTRTFK